MPARKQPMKRGQPLRAEPSRKPRKPIAAKPARTGDVSPETRALVAHRAGYRCEVRAPGCSGRNLAPHHRRSRKHGDHRAENLVYVCQDCHTDSPEAIHRNVARSRALGLLVPFWEGPPATAWDRTAVDLPDDWV